MVRPLAADTNFSTSPHEARTFCPLRNVLSWSQRTCARTHPGRFGQNTEAGPERAYIGFEVEVVTASEKQPRAPQPAVLPCSTWGPLTPAPLAEIASRAARIQGMEVRDEPALEPNHVCGIPPERSIIIVQGVLQLLPRETRVHRPVDQFFRAFARSGGTRPSAGSCPARLRQDATAQQEGMRHHLRLRGLRAPPPRPPGRSSASASTSTRCRRPWRRTALVHPGALA